MIDVNVGAALWLTQAALERRTGILREQALRDLALTLARVWPEVLSNAVDPGWVARITRIR
jgi:hypothetical protein